MNDLARTNELLEQILRRLEGLEQRPQAGSLASYGYYPSPFYGGGTAQPPSCRCGETPMNPYYGRAAC